MVDNIIKSVAEKLSSLSYIEGIVLGGSRARGTHTEDSDIDIGIYYNSESFDINSAVIAMDSVRIGRLKMQSLQSIALCRGQDFTM